MPHVKRRRIPLGPWAFHVALPAHQAERIRRTVPYRYLVKPALAALERAASPFDSQPAQNGDLPPGVDDTPEAREIMRQIADVGWYHTIDLGYGVSTPGLMDHRDIIDRYHLPERFDGKTALDVATFDGFWAFEFERRGAADVVALDIDRWSDADMRPAVRDALVKRGMDGATGEGFFIAKDIRKSRVRRRTVSVYDLSPERVGTFDFVFLSDLLIHLMSPIRALQNVRAVTRGEALIAEIFDPDLGEESVSRYKRGWGSNFAAWWFPSLPCLLEMIEDAGFRKVEVLDRFQLGTRNEEPYWRAVIRARP